MFAPSLRPTAAKLRGLDVERKRVLLIARSILAAGKLAQYHGRRHVPATIRATADAVPSAEQITEEIDRRWPSGIAIAKNREKEMSDRTAVIRQIAEDVYRTLGSGFSEEVYDRAMQVGLRLANIGYEGQKVVELKYKDHYVGEGYPDLVVHLGEERLVVELKAISGELGASEEQQLRNYMTILNVRRGMLINFQQPGRKQGTTKLDIREIAF